ARVWFDAPFARANTWEGARAAVGEVAEALLDLSRADCVVSLDADLFAHGPGHLRHARDFAATRRPRHAKDAMSRLYVVEPAPTPTGILADHRFATRASDVPALAAMLLVAVARAMGRPVPAVEGTPTWIDAAARDLAARNGRALVVAGDA